MLLYDDLRTGPIVDDHEYELIQAMKLLHSEAIQETIKTGKATHFATIEREKNLANAKCEKLATAIEFVTKVQLEMLIACSLFWVRRPGADTRQISEAIPFFAKMLEDEHRDIRLNAVEALINVTKIACAAAGGGIGGQSKSLITTELSAQIASIQQDLNIGERKRGDRVALISAMTLESLGGREPEEEDLVMLRKVNDLLINCWADVERTVVQTSLKGSINLTRLSCVRRWMLEGETKCKSIL